MQNENGLRDLHFTDGVATCMNIANIKHCYLKIFHSSDVSDVSFHRLTIQKRKSEIWTQKYIHSIANKTGLYFWSLGPEWRFVRLAPFHLRRNISAQRQLEKQSLFHLLNIMYHFDSSLVGYKLIQFTK